MKEVKLLKLVIRNFKGVNHVRGKSEVVVEFGHNTLIKGQNESGKTTVQDAFNWLLFGKNSNAESKFGFKPVDTDPASPTYGQEIHNLSTSVEGFFLVDGVEVVLKKESNEKWVTKRGESTKTFTGNELTLYCDTLAIPLKQFTAKVAEVIPEDVFRLLTDPLYFNSLEWAKKRDIVFEIIGDINIEQVQEYDKSLLKLNDFLGNHTVEQAMQIVKQERSKLKEEQKRIPARIDEQYRSIGDPIVTGRYIAEKEAAEVKRDDLQNQLSDASRVNESKVAEIDSLNAKIRNIRLGVSRIAEKALSDTREGLKSARNKLNELKAKAESSAMERTRLVDKVKHLEQSIKDQNDFLVKEKAKKDDLANAYMDAKAKLKFQLAEIKEMDVTCPTCGQILPQDDVYKKKEELSAAAHERCNNACSEVGMKGKSSAKRIEEIKFKIAELTDQLDEVNSKLENLVIVDISEELARAEEEYQEASLTVEGAQADIDYLHMPEKEKSEIEALQKQIDDLRLNDTNASSVIRSQIKEQQEIIDKCNRKLQEAKQQQKAKDRIEDLQAELKANGDKIAELDKQEFLCERFIVKKVELADRRVYDAFDGVEFKLFENQINGGVKSTCQTLVKGVPWSDANTGHKYNVGLKIIKVLSNHYGYTAPVFIDNRERVNDWNIPKMESQTIHMIVSSDPELVVEVTK